MLLVYNPGVLKRFFVCVFKSIKLPFEFVSVLRVLVDCFTIQGLLYGKKIKKLWPNRYSYFIHFSIQWLFILNRLGKNFDPDLWNFLVLFPVALLIGSHDGHVTPWLLLRAILFQTSTSSAQPKKRKVCMESWVHFRFTFFHYHNKKVFVFYLINKYVGMEKNICLSNCLEVFCQPEFTALVFQPKKTEISKLSTRVIA